MTRQQILILAAIGVVLLALVGFAVLRDPAPSAATEASVDDDQPVVELDGPEAGLTLYFPGSGGWLVSEERSVPGDSVGLDQVIAEVLAGPAGERRSAPFPEGTEVGSVFISEDGIAFVDLLSTRQSPPSSGSRQELLSVYSLVNSAFANLPNLSGVVLLWNGQQRNSFAGHLDTGRPLEENRSIIAN